MIHQRNQQQKRYRFHHSPRTHIMRKWVRSFDLLQRLLFLSLVVVVRIRIDNVTSVDVDFVDVTGEGDIISSGISSNDHNDGSDNKETDDPWDLISKFIQSNILFGSNINSKGSNNNNNEYDDATASSGVLDHIATSSSRTLPNENIWNSFRSSPNNDIDVDQEDSALLDTADTPDAPRQEANQQQQQQQINDIIKEGWNQFVQNLGSVPNPFTTNTGRQDDNNNEKDDTFSSQHRQNFHPNTGNHNRYDALTDLIESVSSAGHLQYNKNTKHLSIPDMIDVFWTTIQSVKQQLEGTFKSVLDLILPIVNPLKVYYFMLEQEIVHNPVYKRREHAYYTDVSVHTAIQISEGLYVSQLAYASDCTTIQKHLKLFQNNSWILINCTTTPQPLQPAHFLAIRQSTFESNVTWNYPMDSSRTTSNDASSTTSSSWTTMLWENIRDALNLTNMDNTRNNKNMELEAMLVICGTKDVADMMSDALLEPTPYGNSTHQGLAHSGIYQSALYIHDTYRDFLENLIQKTNRTKLKLWLIGHSLGGGTAALACLEFNKPYHHCTNHTANTGTNVTSSISTNLTKLVGDMNGKYVEQNTLQSIDAYALGFGTPAVLSREYAEAARSKVTTIINDADCVPRMSGATLVNFLLNVTASNHWISEAQIDVLHLKSILKEKSPFPEVWIDMVMTTIYDWIATSDLVNDTMKAKLAEKIVTPVLFPPGECIHIYRDGTSWQGVYYPCHNFNALEGVRYMVDDHLIPTGYYRGLLGYIRGIKNDMNWQFQPDLTEIPVSS